MRLGSSGPYIEVDKKKGPYLRGGRLAVGKVRGSHKL